MTGFPVIPVVDLRLPRRVICPHCQQKQLFIKQKEHWCTLKAPHLEHPVLLRVRTIYTKCQNADCLHKSFALPMPGIERYQRATQPLISEAVAGVVQDNGTLRRIAKRLSRSFNTTGSKSTLDRWTEKEHLLIPEMIEIYKGTPVEKVLLFKEDLYNIFDLSETKAEAIAKRNNLAKEKWWQDSWHLQKCMDFLMSPKFHLMLTYLEDPQIPRCGQSETLINVWRQMEVVRRGFKTFQGRLNHLKLFQITNYLKEPI